MKTRLIYALEQLHSTYWFLPALLAAIAIGLATVALTVDQAAADRIQSAGWIYVGGADGAWALLSTVAGSMIGVAGVTYSITIVVLALASSQFGPRLISSFMRDTSTQVVLGVFIATFVYCILVLRTVSSAEETAFVPHLSVTVGVLLALISMGVLIYFIHHVSASIQVENIIDHIGRELDEAIDRLLPSQARPGQPTLELRHEEDLPEDFESEAQPIAALQTGYLQALDHDGLIRLAREHNVLLRLQRRPGDFVARGGELVDVWPGGRRDEDFIEAVNDAFLIGAQRQRLQDVEYAINQLVEIALRALSAAYNDPFTAIACIDRLGAALAHLAERSIPSAYRYDEAGRLRLVTRRVTFAGLTDAAFNQLRQSSTGYVAVTVRLLEAIAIAAAGARNDTHRAALLRHADMIKRASDETVKEPGDQAEIEERYQRVLEGLEGGN